MLTKPNILKIPFKPQWDPFVISFLWAGKEPQALQREALSYENHNSILIWLPRHSQKHHAAGRAYSDLPTCAYAMTLGPSIEGWLCLHRVVVKLKVDSGYFACPTSKGCLCNYSFYYKSTSQTCYGDLYPILKTVHTRNEKMVHDFKNQVKDCIIWLAKWSMCQ